MVHGANCTADTTEIGLRTLLDARKRLNSLKNSSGRVLIDHFYDNIAPLSDTEKRAIAEAPDFDEELKKELWLGSTEGAPKKLIELLQQPSLNIRGMASARVGAQASECDSIDCDREHRYAAGKGHGS